MLAGPHPQYLLGTVEGALETPASPARAYTCLTRTGPSFRIE